MIVVDSSVALQWVVPEAGASVAEGLLGRADLAAPDILLIESANVLAKKVRAGDATIAGARAGLQLIRDSVAKLVASSELADDAMRLSTELRHPVYDCCFLACALQMGASLATRDRRFIERLTSRGHGDLLFPLGLE